MKEDYVNFEIAKLLKEKGFDWECLNWYSTKGNLYHYADSFEIDLDGITELCSAPTLQMAMKWLREKGIIISISYVRRNLQTIGSQMVFEFKIQNADGELLFTTTEFTFEFYEAAAEYAIKYCLTNLI